MAETGQNKLNNNPGGDDRVYAAECDVGDIIKGAPSKSDTTQPETTSPIGNVGEALLAAMNKENTQ